MMRSPPQSQHPSHWCSWRQDLWRGEPAWISSAGPCHVVVLPNHGGKIASLTWQGLELLQQGPNPGGLVPPDPTRGYEGCECAGIDDCCPSVDAGPMASGPFRGVPLPDHGEAWSQVAALAVHDQWLVAQMLGKVLPWRLERAILVQGKRLMCRYRARNRSAQSIPFLWAWHPLFQACEGMLIHLPTGITSLRNALESDPDAPRLPWPLAGVYPLGPADGRSFTKGWVDSPMALGRVILEHPQGGYRVLLDWDVAKLPALGLWINRGGILGQYVVAPEPATMPADHPELPNAMTGILAPGASHEWWLTITVQGRDEALVLEDHAVPPAFSFANEP